MGDKKRPTLTALGQLPVAVTLNLLLPDMLPQAHEPEKDARFPALEFVHGAQSAGQRTIQS